MPQSGTGILKLTKNKGKTRALLVNPEEYSGGEAEGIIVPFPMIKQYNLVEGAVVTGQVRGSGKNTQLANVETVGGLTPQQFAKRIPYTKLTAITPEQRFNLSTSGNMSMRVVDLLAPIAKGTRGLIVSPPRAGKTILLEQIAMAIHAADPKTRIIAFLIDERPEEVTHFRRQVEAEVIASSNDRNITEHTNLAQFVMSHVITELECGRDVVVLVDSLTRMARAFNLKGSPEGKGRIMSGGIQAGTLEIPRRFFGMARNIENGGSVTIIATVLVDTGSRMDQLIFEEFKGTGNSEIVLDRKLAEARVFPAININASGTRREELLFKESEYQQVTKLRRALSAVKSGQEGMELLLKFLNKYPTNQDFLNDKS